MSREMKKLSETELYRRYNQNGKIDASIGKTLRGSTDVTPLIARNLDTISRKFKFLGVHDIIAATKDRSVVPIYCTDPTSKLTVGIPVVLVKKDEKASLSCLVNLTNYATLSEDGSYLEINDIILFALLTTGYVHKGCVLNWSDVQRDTKISILGASIFAEMISRIINGIHTLRVNPINQDKLFYLASKYFTINIMGMPNNQGATNVAMRKVNVASKDVLESIDDDSSYDSIFNFVETLAREIKPLSGLTTDVFIENWVRSYSAASLMALEYFPAFCFMMTNIEYGTHITNQLVLDKLVGKQVSAFHNSLISAIK